MGFNWTKSDLPTGSAISIRVADNTWYSRCRACDHDLTEKGTYPAPRWSTIGKHEYNVHGLDVAGINVGILS